MKQRRRAMVIILEWKSERRVKERDIDGDERKRVSDEDDESDEGGSQEREKSDEAEK